MKGGHDLDAEIVVPHAAHAGDGRFDTEQRLRREGAEGDDHARLDEVDLDLGDEVEILGETFTIAGLTEGLTNLVNSVTFIRLRDFQELRRSDAVSYALLKVKPGYDPGAVAAAITARNDDDVNALTRPDFAREERQIIQDMSVEVINIMNLAGLLIGLAVTALTLYTSTLHKRQEYGVLKAIGAKNWQLYMVVIAQAVLSLTWALPAIGLVKLALPL
jgi:putative ABC transport system permease protein